MINKDGREAKSGLTLIKGPADVASTPKNYSTVDYWLLSGQIGSVLYSLYHRDFAYRFHKSPEQ